jgi:hypothetical protein
VAYFHQVDHHLLTKTIVGDRLAYNHCPKVQRVAVHGALDRERKGLYAGKLTLKQQKDFEKRVSLFNSANIIFKFFFSPDAKIPTVRRFWGAVEELVKVWCRQPPHTMINMKTYMHQQLGARARVPGRYTISPGDAKQLVFPVQRISTVAVL